MRFTETSRILASLFAGVLLALGVGTAASAQTGDLAVCVDLTNDADGDRSFADGEEAMAAGEVAHQVTIDNCGNTDAEIDLVVAIVGAGELTVCGDLTGEPLAVDEIRTCEFDLPVGANGSATRAVVTVSADGLTADGEDATTVTVAATEEPADEPTEDATEAGGDVEELAATGVWSLDLLAWSLLLLATGVFLVDAGLRGAYAFATSRRGAEFNPLLAPMTLGTRLARHGRDVARILTYRRR